MLPREVVEKVYQIKYLKVKTNRIEQFVAERKLYEHRLSREEGLTFQGLFQSFFSFPQRKAKNAFVEITEWESIQAYELATNSLRANLELNEYFDCFEIEANYRMQPENQVSIEITEMLKSGYAIEFASRQIKPNKRAIYPGKRLDFMYFIKAQDGFVFDQEFKCIDEDIDILLFAWQSKDDFYAAGKKVKRSIKQLIKTLKYFTLIDQKAFQVGVKFDVSKK